MKKVLLTFGVSFLLMTIITSCGPREKTADEVLQKQTSETLREANNQIGLPAIVNFQEKKLMKQIYELRDQEDLICFAYYLDMNGGKHFLGKCIGYGIPYSTQFSNPQKQVYRGGHGQSFGSMPQAEPNGLFMPDGLSATWLLLLDEKGNPHPIYIESEIIVSPFKLK